MPKNNPDHPAHARKSALQLKQEFVDRHLPPDIQARIRQKLDQEWIQGFIKQHNLQQEGDSAQDAIDRARDHIES